MILLEAQHHFTQRAELLQQTDPHGFTLTLIAVCTVFSALLILFCVYTLSGNIFSGKYRLPKRQKKAKAPKGASKEAEVAAAIAMALSQAGGGEECVAIATALHLYLSESIHDAEPYVLTIKRNASAWENKQLNFRKSR